MESARPRRQARSPSVGEERLAALLELRSQVQKELEPFRAQKKSSLDAHVRLSVDASGRVGGRLSETGAA